MVLESDTECQTKVVHIIDFSVRLNYNVGRRASNDICVSDITVSRMQASI
jgi:pSer/pThr/pTyr-binding forkhead associated (FHA) protein